MTRWWRLVLGLLALLGHSGFAETARADTEDPVAVTPQDSRSTFFELGFRTGYGIPIGKATDSAGDDMNKLIAGQIPIWVDIGARINRHLALGAYFSYGFGFLGSEVRPTCEELESAAAAAGASASCSTSDLRLGFQVGYHFSPSQSLDPWIGGGIGYEMFSFSTSASVDGQSATVTLDATGFEYVNVQSGLDFRLAENFGLGPFLALSLASYDELGASCSGDCGLLLDASASIEDQSIHAWLFLGLRGVALF